MKTSTLLSMLLFVPLVNVQPSFAQSDWFPSSDGYLAERQDVYRTTSSSAEDLNSIPEFEVYRFVFLRILGNASLLNQVDNSDLEKVLALPDHNDIQFLEVFQKDLQTACTEINESQNRKKAHELVSIFLAAEKTYEQTLNDHYVSFLDTLSKPTNDLVLGLIIQLSESNSMAHTRTNYVGFSEEFPDYMKTKILDGCDRVLTDSTVPEKRLLTDILIHRDSLNLGAR